MKCPKCGKEIAVAKEVARWQKNDAHQVPAGEPAMLNCVCSCGDGGVWIEMIPYTENKDIVAPLS